MARWFIRKFSIKKILGAYKSQWKRLLRRFTRFGYGVKGFGWWRDPKRAWYNFWYNRTSVGLTWLFGGGRVRGASLFGALIASLFMPEETARKQSAKGSSKQRSAKTKNAAGADPGSRRQASQKQSEAKTTRLTGKRDGLPKAPVKPVAPPETVPVLEKRPVQAAPPPVRDPQEEILPQVKPEPSIYLEPTASKTNDLSPKSTPRGPADRFIRKRMVLAETGRVDRELLSRLEVGAYVELAAEPDDPNDKNAVALLYRGEKIGYVPKEESFSYSVCIKMKQAVYGVITDIVRDESEARYEFETWFADRR